MRSEGGSELPALLLLAPGDDVLIAVRDLTPGAHVASDGRRVEVLEPVALGHKVAARALAAGERVLRCGVPIGSMSAGAEPGTWVHTHNLRSDYIPTFARRGGVR
jgi:altronate dehydratase small subunit